MRSNPARPARSSSKSADRPAAAARTPAPTRRSAALLVAALAFGASVRGLFNDFVYDDIPLIRDNARVHDLAHVREIFTSAYWPPPFVEQLYRPLTVVLLAAEYTLGGGSPLVFRLVSYLLYAVATVLVYRMATRVLGPWPALATAALFAVHPVHVEAVALGVNQAELGVGIAAIVMTTRYIDRRRSGAGTLDVRDWILLAVLYAVSTLVKESAFVLPLLLIVAELTVLRADAMPFRRRNAVVGFGLLAAAAAGSLVLRRVVVGEPAFAVVPASDLRGLNLGGRALLMLHVVPNWLRLFVWPHHLQVDFAPGAIASGGATEAVLGFAILVGLAVAIAVALRRAPALAFGLLWMAIALLPVSNLVPTGVLLAERTLFVPSMGFLVAAGAIVEKLLASRRLPPKPTRRALAWGCIVLVVLGMLRSVGRQAVWNTRHLEVVPRTPIGGRAAPVRSAAPSNE